MSTTVTLPKEKLDFSIDENDYSITFPNNGEYIEIEGMKARLTRDTYNSMAVGVSVSAQMARYTVDMIACLSVLCPKIKEDLKVESFSELKMIDSKRILKVYIDKILPWLTEWESVLNAEDEAAAE